MNISTKTEDDGIDSYLEFDTNSIWDQEEKRLEIDFLRVKGKSTADEILDIANDQRKKNEY